MSRRQAALYLSVLATAALIFVPKPLPIGLVLACSVLLAMAVYLLRKDAA